MIMAVSALPYTHNYSFSSYNGYTVSDLLFFFGTLLFVYKWNIFVALIKTSHKASEMSQISNVDMWQGTLTK